MVNTPFQLNSQQPLLAMQSPPKIANEDKSLTKPPLPTSQSMTQQQQLPQRKQIKTLKKQFTKPNLSAPVIPNSQLITPNLSKGNNPSDSTPTSTTTTTTTTNNNNNNNSKSSINKDKPFHSITFAPTTNVINDTALANNKKEQKGPVYNNDNNNSITLQQPTISNNKTDSIMMIEKGKSDNVNQKQIVNLNDTHFINYNNQNLQFESKVQPAKKPLKKNWGKQKEYKVLNFNSGNQDININAKNLFSQPSTNEKPKKTKRGRPPTSKTTDKSIDDNDIDASLKSKKMNKKSSKASNTNTLYCICQKPYDAPSFMIACDRCDQWFHGECINISEKEGEFIDLYFCSNCNKETGRSTSWKPKCINSACNKAARISTNQGYKSKYCSYECGMEVARSQLESADKQQYTTTNDKDIYEFIISKRKKCRLLSYAHKEDHENLEKLKIEKNQHQKMVKLIDLKLKFLKSILKQVHSLDICGFDSRLIWDDIYWKEVTDVTTTNDDLLLLHYIPNSELISKTYDQCKLKKKECHKHHQWQKILTAELEQERKEQLNRLISLDKEKRNIKTRIHQRSDNNNLVNIISNHTIIH
ncbi:unnamed protein product [Cunninghamella blakesleeana]